MKRNGRPARACVLERQRGRARSSARQARRRASRARVEAETGSSARTGRARQRRPTRAPMSTSSIVPTCSSTSAAATRNRPRPQGDRRRSRKPPHRACRRVVHGAPASTWARRSAGGSYIGPKARPSVVAVWSAIGTPVTFISSNGPMPIPNAFLAAVLDRRQSMRSLPRACARLRSATARRSD